MTMYDFWQWLDFPFLKCSGDSYVDMLEDEFDMTDYYKSNQALLMTSQQSVSTNKLFATSPILGCSLSGDDGADDEDDDIYVGTFPDIFRESTVPEKFSAHPLQRLPTDVTLSLTSEDSWYEESSMQLDFHEYDDRDDVSCTASTERNQTYIPQEHRYDEIFRFTGSQIHESRSCHSV
jgi:hypothetical protein